MAAVDLGAQSGRVAVGRFDGTELQLTEVHRFPNAPVQRRRRLEWDFERLYREALAGLRAAGEVDSVGVDSWAVDFGLVDATGRLLANPVRIATSAAPRRSTTSLEGSRTRAVRPDGHPDHPDQHDLRARRDVGRRNDAFAGAETLLMIPDLMNQRLAGSRVSEYTNATTTQCLDPATGEWAGDLLERLAVPSRILPEVVQPGRCSGPVTADAGLGSGAIGRGRFTRHRVGCRRDSPSRRRLRLHQRRHLVACRRRGRPAADRRPHVRREPDQRGRRRGTYRLLRNVTGLWLLHECRRTWSEAGDAYSFEELVALAEQAPALQALIEPNDPGVCRAGRHARAHP